MTKHFYYISDNTEGQTNLLNCSAELDGRHTAVLDRILFHPQGDGWPADVGWIGDERVEVILACSDDVVHIVVRPLFPGVVNLRMDVVLRQLHVRLHSAGYSIGLMGTAFGWLPVKTYHWPDGRRVTFAAGENGTSPDTLSLQGKINTWQADNLARQVIFTDGLWRTGFGHPLVYPCGGTRVTHLSETEPVVIIQVKMKRGQMITNYTFVP